MLADDPKALASRFHLDEKKAKTISPDRQLNMIRFSPCGKLLFGAGSDGTVRRWEFVGKPVELPPLRGHQGWVTALACHSNLKWLFSIDSWGELRCSNPTDPEAKPTWRHEHAHDGWIRGLALSADGSHLATCGDDRKVCVWDAEKGTKLAELAKPEAEVLAVVFHPLGQRIVAGDLKGTILDWEWKTDKIHRTLDGKVLYLLSRLQDCGGVRVLRFEADGKTLLAAGTTPKSGATLQGSPTILFFDWDSGKLKSTYTLPKDQEGLVYDLAWHPAGFWILVTSGVAGTGGIHYLQSGATEAFFTGKAFNPHSLALHPTEPLLAVSTTNANSNGNGRSAKAGTEYPNNTSPIRLYDLPLR